jgi:hypothetical protein
MGVERFWQAHREQKPLEGNHFFGSTERPGYRAGSGIIMMAAESA